MTEMTSRPKAYCKTCKSAQDFDILARPVAGMPDVKEHVVKCSKCETSIHANFTNEKLERMAREISREHHPIRQAKMVRAYHRKFEQLQKEIGEQVGKIGS